MLRSTDTLRDVTSPAGGAVSTGPLNVSQCEQVTVWFIASGAAAPTNCTVSLCDASGAQILSRPITVAVAGSSPAFAGEGPAPGVANAVALGPVPPAIFASGSGGAASTLRIVVLGLPRATPQPVDSPTPIIPEDPNTVAHVWWQDGIGLIDTRGNSWAMTGTVPQVARTVTAPGGAGVFSDANYYSLGTGNDVLDFAGNFSICVLFQAVTLPGAQQILFGNGVDSASGYYVDTFIGNVTRMVLNKAASRTAASTANTIIVGTNIFCGGWDGVNGLAKLNLGAIASTAFAGPVPATAAAASLGRYIPAVGLSAANEVIYEAWLSTTTPSDALFTNIMQIVKSRLRITAW